MNARLKSEVILIVETERFRAATKCAEERVKERAKLEGLKPVL
jgi:hypothetical protein